MKLWFYKLRQKLHLSGHDPRVPFWALRMAYWPIVLLVWDVEIKGTPEERFDAGVASAFITVLSFAIVGLPALIFDIVTLFPQFFLFELLKDEAVRIKKAEEVAKVLKGKITIIDRIDGSVLVDGAGLPIREVYRQLRNGL